MRALRGVEGFTLLETLVALVVAATAAAVVSAFLRGIISRVEKEQEHQLAVLRLVNRAAVLRTSPLVETRWVYEQNDVLRLVPSRPELPEIEVRNYLPEGSGVPPPPIEIAFTTYQQMTVRENRYGLHFLRPALPSPVRKSGGTNAPANTTESVADSRWGSHVEGSREGLPASQTTLPKATESSRTPPDEKSVR